MRRQVAPDRRGRGRVAGVRARLFGFGDLEFQLPYHFTVRGPTEDSRLTTLAPYGVHVEARERGADLP